MIEILKLKKTFGKLEVLKEISFSLPSGKITAILGPNASGKSTLIKCILGLVRPDHGDIQMDGKSLLKEWKYRKYLGYMPQIARFPENLTVRELFLLLEDLQEGAIQEDLELYQDFALEEYLPRSLRILSGGTRQKINAFMAFRFSPQVLLLDEPTVGMDPLSSLRLKEKIRKTAGENKTIILTSHIMSEVEEIADHIIFLLEGNVHFQGSLESLEKETGQKGLERCIVKLMEKKNGPTNLENPQV